jgi:acyl-CoA reductase-like NAD-dependent aldehyde dehydrogenase
MSLLAETPLRRPDIESFKSHIGGEWTAASNGGWLDNVNPADTNDIVGRFPASTSNDAEAAVRAAAAAFAAWRKTPISTRAKILNKAADYLEANAENFGAEMTREQGKHSILPRTKSCARRRRCVFMLWKDSPLPARFFRRTMRA